MRPLLHRLLAWLLAGFDDSRCPYECPTHRHAWRAWRERNDRPGFRPGEYR